MLAAPISLQGTVLLVIGEQGLRGRLRKVLQRAGCEVALAATGSDARRLVAAAIPDLILLDLALPRAENLALLRELRADPITRGIPVILLVPHGARAEVIAALDVGADDFLPRPCAEAELLALVRAKLQRPSLPREYLPSDRQTGLLSERLFFAELRREVRRHHRDGEPGCLACLNLHELPGLREQFGTRLEAEIAREVALLFRRDAGPLELAARDRRGRFLLLLPESTPEAAQERLEGLLRRIADREFSGGGARVRLTPAAGFVPFGSGDTVHQIRRDALSALAAAECQLDLFPVRYRPEGPALQEGGGAKGDTRNGDLWHCFLPTAIFMEGRLRLPLQITLTFLLALVLPFFLYAAVGTLGIDPTPPAYLAVVLAMLWTAVLIGMEGRLALRQVEPPADPGPPYPAASAIIAAYLPNEAPVILETIEAFLQVRYPGPLQVILAYSTPRDLPVEAALQEIARRDERLLLLREGGKIPKAQVVNAALAKVRGEFVGIFDADHQPDPDVFTRAWRWLSNGCDVVQGHCLVRNGESSWVARLVAVEFETIYAVSHPGRARLHGFGLFGGSNGFWKTERLRQTRMRGWMLTEDIDSSMRVAADGGKIVSDPGLISRELAPLTLTALWRQRMRWAQGWFQVSYRHIKPSLRSPSLSWRQKLGIAHLLVWREIYPWLSLQILPMMAYKLWWRGERIHWFIPFFVFTTLVMLSTGPAQIWFTWRLAHPDVKRHGRWFVWCYLLSILFYVEWKNVIARVAHLKELMREREWIITPRARMGT